MKQIVFSLVIGACLLLPAAGVALAASTGNTGRPNQSCGSQASPNTPGNAASAPGSAFNPGGQAGSVYAGQQTQNSGNGQASQYDVACFQQNQVP